MRSVQPCDALFANPEVFSAVSDAVQDLIQSVFLGITLAQVDRSKDAYSIESCLSFSYRPIIPTVNYHFQSTDVPTCIEGEMDEP